jgi:molybdopterin molybdotransferase
MAIGTGGLVPPGADAIAIKEIVRREGSRLTVRERVEAGAHIRRAGHELRSGDVVLARGTRLGPVHLAAAAAAGVRQLVVGRRPRVAVLATGSELVPAGDALEPGQVVEVNTPFLAASLEVLLGTTPRALDPATDDRAALRSALAAGLDGAEVLVLSGGVSVGDRDLVKEVLEDDLEVRRVLWRVAQKPGKPTYVGRRGGAWVVGLPGNPAAVATGWQTLVRPLLLALMGDSNPRPAAMPARLVAAVTPEPVRTHLRWCTSRWRERELWVEALPRSDSHMLSDLARADSLALVPAGSEPLPAGTPVEVIPIQ